MTVRALFARRSPKRKRALFSRAWGGAAALAAVLLAGAAALAESAPPVRFNRDIRPILSDRCLACHGPGTREAGLRLDVRDDTVREADSGATPIVPGQPQDSELVRRILSDDPDEVMPPAGTNKPLSSDQQELLRRWIEQGAVYEQHWSFEPPVQAEPPRVDDAALRINNPIDAFLADALRDARLGMAPEADRETLIRRLALALTGLPPTLEEVDAFLGDTSPDAYDKLVDRYLASERFGEEMARHWLDVARYADTHGLHLDNERQMWAYRDWVIRAFNRNQPFDQFTIDQLAGDLLPDASQDQLTATGFLRCNVTTGEGGSIEAEWVYRNAVDRASTVAAAWLGLTAGCCVCHDHKYDPLPIQDFYSLYAFFHSAADPALDGNALLTPPSLKLATAEDQRQLAEFDAQIADRQRRLDEQVAALDYTDPATLDPPPPAEVFEHIWFDDDIPSGSRVSASPGHPTEFVTAQTGQVRGGQKALKRTDKGLAQDVIEGAPPLEIPPAGILFGHVWIDPGDPPRTLMLQYFQGGWRHRAVWGDYDAIDWGARDTTERVLIGPLPAAGQWVRLEAEAERLGLKAGDRVTGFALTQFGGSLYWDQIGVAGRSDPAADPQRSLLAWWNQQTGKDTAGVPPELNRLLKAGPDQKPSDDLARKLRDYYLQHVCRDTQAQLAAPVQELSALRRQREELDQRIPSTFIYRDLGQPQESFVMLRGQYDAPGDRIEPGVPGVLPPLGQDVAGRRANRLDLARWLVAPEHPLTARVTVNRFWQQFFGIGLVKTSFDFGSQGELPSHPELLDWLAVAFRDSGWDVKWLVKQLVSSAAFRQSSQLAPELAQRDPENRLLARGPRFRLDAEPLRDNALFVGGLIQLEMGGRGVKPYQPPNIWEPVGFVGSNTANYRQDSGPALYRRSIYVFFKRTAPPPFMTNFDAPNREAFCTRRDRSNTPLQALQLMNDIQHYEAARGLAQRLLAAGGATPQERIVHGYRLVLARRPEAEEAAIVHALLEHQLARYRRDPAAAAQAIRVGESAPPAGVDEAELAAYTLVANLLLNLDETVTRN